MLARLMWGEEDDVRMLFQQYVILSEGASIVCDCSTIKKHILLNIHWSF